MNLNKKHNLKNPFQGQSLKVLCVCSAGLLRSPTAANVLHTKFGWNTRACGSNEEYSLIHINEGMVYWADKILFMNQENFDEASFYTPEIDVQFKNKCHVLDIPDSYGWMDERLQKIILDKVSALNLK